MKNIAIGILVVLIGILAYQMFIQNEDYSQLEIEAQKELRRLDILESKIKHKEAHVVAIVDSLNKQLLIRDSSLTSLRSDLKRKRKTIEKFTNKQINEYYSNRYPDDGDINKKISLTENQAIENIKEVEERDELLKEVSVLKQKEITYLGIIEQNNILIDEQKKLNTRLFKENRKLIEEKKESKKAEKKANKRSQLLGGIAITLGLLLLLK